jgi:hypothetical protein
MTYLKSYIAAVFDLSKLLGLVFLVSALFFGMGAAIPFVYVALVAGLAGPLSVAIRSRSAV